MTDEPLPRRVLRILEAPTDVAALVAFRVIFGLVVAIGATRFLVEGWVTRCYVEPTFAFKYWGFGWVKAWPAWGMHLHVIVVALLGLMLAAGLFYRWTAALLFVAFTYAELIDVTVYLNHYYLVSLLALLCAFLPLGDAGSLDVIRNPERRARSFPAWCTYLLRFQVAVVYVFAGLTKLGSDWLLHAQPMQIWLSARSDLPILGPLLNRYWVAVAMSWAGFLYDLTIPAWLSWRRTRLIAYAVLLGFHTAVGVLFNIGMFPFIMTGVALVFFEPSWPRTLWARFGRIAAAWQAPTDGVPGLGRSGRSRFGLALGAGYVVLQILLPLRHLAYPGDVLWNEQGMRWAWKVLVREKNGAVRFRVTQRDGRTRIVEPRNYLTEAQAREMSGQPDLILQLAHRIASDFDARGLGPVEVRADAAASLNGRRPKRLIDPDVDLARIEDGLGVADWILDAPEEPPMRLRSLAGGWP